MTSIMRGSAEFESVQLARILRSRIAEGVYQPGQRIPALRDLRDEFGLALKTVHRAVHSLADEKLLTIVPGRGTFVAEGDGTKAG